MFLCKTIAVFLILIGSVSAQTSGGFVAGQTLPASQLNTALGSKADATNGVLTTPTLNGATINNGSLNGAIISGGSIIGSVAGNPTFTGNPTNLLKTVPSVVSAAGTTQGTATVLVSQLNVVSTVAPGTGVVSTGAYTEIWNAGANDLLVYPISGAQFDAVGTNNPITVPLGGAVKTIMTTGTQGYAR